MLYQNVLVSLRALTRKLILSCDGSCHRSAVLFEGGIVYRGLRLDRLHPRLCSIAPLELWVDAVSKCACVFAGIDPQAHTVL